MLTEEEQAELRELQAFVLALRRELPGGSGLSLLSAVSVIARSGRRETGAAPPEGGQAHLALGDGRGLGDRSPQRKPARPVDRALPGGAGGTGRFEEDAGPALALAAEEQREQLEAVREIRALMLEGEDAGPLVSDMQERIAVMFAAWASAMAGSGRSEELCAALASVVGEERARIAAASVVASGAVCREAGEGSAGRRRKDRHPPGPAAVRQAPSPPPTYG